MTVDDVIARAQAVVRARGGDLKVEGGRAVLDLAGTRAERPVLTVTSSAEYRALTRTDHGAGGHLVLLDRASPLRADELRRAGAWFIDVSGRMFVQTPGVLIDVDRALAGTSAAPATTRHREARRAEPVNLMSPVRAQVVFALLAWPDLAAAPVRELAEIAGTSVGVVVQVKAALRADGHLSTRPARLLRPDDLLDQWAAAYGRGLGAHTELRRFAGEPTTTGWTAGGRQVLVSGDAALDELSGPELVLYVDELDKLAILRSRWSVADDRRANIIVRRWFWVDPHPETQAQAQQATVRRAPDVLVLADLLADRDPRHLDAAVSLREQILARLRRDER